MDDEASFWSNGEALDLSDSCALRLCEPSVFYVITCIHLECQYKTNVHVGTNPPTPYSSPNYNL